MVEEQLNLKETYYLIFSNINDKFEKLINNEYLIKVNNEFVKNEIVEKNIEDIENLKKDIKENIEEYKIYELPLYYPQDPTSSNLLENKFNQFLLSTMSDNAEYKKIYFNEYISKENGKFFLYEINSDESISIDLSETTKKEELDILYDYKKIEIDENSFNEKLTNVVKNISLKYFHNMGLNLNKENNTFQCSLTNELEKNLDKSILVYIFNKHKEKIDLLKNSEYKHLSNEEYEYQFINKVIDIHKNEFLKNEFIYLKSIFSNILYEDLNKESLLVIKNYILNATNNFNDFLLNNKDKVLNSFNNLFSEKEIINRIDLNQLEKKMESKLIDKTNINLKNIFEENDEWKKIKAFLFESLISKESFFIDFYKNNIEAFPKHINKRINDKVYHIDLENQSILWSFVNKEKDLEYHKEKKEIFNNLKQEYITENPDITKDELRTKLNHITSREVSPNEFIEHIGYTNDNFNSSNLNLLNKVLNEKVDVFYNNLLYSFELFKNNFDEDYFKDIKKYDKDTNYLNVLNDIIQRNELNNKEALNLINLINNNDIQFNDIKYINNILEYVEEDKQEIYKKVLSEYVYSMLNKTIELIKPIQFDDSISINNNCFKDFFVVRKIISIAKDYLENNQIKYDINNIEKEKFDLESICDINSKDKLDLCSYFDNLDTNIINDINDVEDFLKNDYEEKENNLEEDLDIIKF